MTTPQEALYRAMCSLDSDDPGVFNIVAISEPDTRPVADALAAALTASGYSIVPTAEVEGLRKALNDAMDAWVAEFGPPDYPRSAPTWFRDARAALGDAR